VLPGAQPCEVDGQARIGCEGTLKGRSAAIVARTPEPRTIMKRPLVILYGFVAYALFLASFVYAIAWLANLFVPITIDRGVPGASVGEAIAIDLLLLAAFAIQHSVMARPAFKRWWTRIIPQPIERSTYVLASSLALFAVCLGWRSLPAVVWQAHGAVASALSALFWAGWLVALASTFMIDHLDLFGLRQTFARPAGARAGATFKTPLLYRYVRHPLMLGLAIAFWATPLMTSGHLLFAIATTIYIVLGVRLEERDLLRELGTAYQAYRERVPMLLPGTKSMRRALAAQSSGTDRARER
jgi:protein-S-isoprenylcysteine O-methyltransferase Ste14